MRCPARHRRWSGCSPRWSRCCCAVQLRPPSPPGQLKRSIAASHSDRSSGSPSAAAREVSRDQLGERPHGLQIAGLTHLHQPGGVQIVAGEERQVADRPARTAGSGRGAAGAPRRSSPARAGGRPGRLPANAGSRVRRHQRRAPTAASRRRAAGQLGQHAHPANSRRPRPGLLDLLVGVGERRHRRLELGRRQVGSRAPACARAGGRSGRCRDAAASAKQVTGPGWQNAVSMAPTRLTVTPLGGQPRRPGRPRSAPGRS